jgi:hypothetical protein
VLGNKDQPPCIAKVSAKDRAKTAALTARAWFVRELLSEAGQACGTSRIAARLVTMELNEGVSLATLKNRVPTDLARA